MGRPLKGKIPTFPNKKKRVVFNIVIDNLSPNVFYNIIRCGFKFHTKLTHKPKMIEINLNPVFINNIVQIFIPL